jgi:hypothetical protein
VTEDTLIAASRPPSPIHPPNPDSNPLAIEPKTTARISILETNKNVFSLYRRYFAQQFPTHDPENEADISNQSNVIDPHNSSESSYGPYPNESSFRLGEWFWKRSVEKSQTSFRDLVSIVGDEGFQPLDIKSTNWEKINNCLAGVGSDKCEWLDEDASWTASSVKISIPFHCFAQQPGPQNYVVANFHHRSLVLIIKEKLGRQDDARLFHYEPYELLWQCPGACSPLCVQGKLFTSPAFLDAHKSLQELPREPGCNLPQVIVALMLWSDSTHLTSFGNTKLWPLYLFFGNESKYRQGRPSLNLCEHVAYLETVRSANAIQTSILKCLFSCLLLSKILSCRTWAIKNSNRNSWPTAIVSLRMLSWK